MTQQAQECQRASLSVWGLTAPRTMLSISSFGSHCQCFLGQDTGVRGLCSNLSGCESNAARSESITLSIRFDVPMEMTYICSSSRCLKLLSGAYFPLACAPFPLSTTDKASKFRLLVLCQMQSQFTSLPLLQSKNTLGNILN